MDSYIDPEHTLELFRGLIITVADRIFVGDDGDTQDLKDSFIRTALSEEGTDILSQAFTSHTASRTHNFRVAAFRGDKLMASILSDYAINSNQDLSVRQLTELNTTVGGGSGQVNMFKSYELLNYVRMGIGTNPHDMGIHFHTTVIEAFFDAIYRIGELTGQGMGYSIASNLLYYHLNLNPQYDAERLWASWVQQVEENMGKTYGDGIKHFASRRDNVNGRVKVTLTMDADSAEDLNKNIRNNPVLHFPGMRPLASKTVEGVADDYKEANSEAFRLMAQYFNELGYNFNWRMMYRRVINLRTLAGKYPKYANSLNKLAESGMFNYIKESGDRESGRVLLAEHNYLGPDYDPNVILVKQLEELWIPIRLKKDIDKEAAITQLYDKFYKENRVMVEGRIQAERERQRNLDINLEDEEEEEEEEAEEVEEEVEEVEEEAEEEAEEEEEEEYD